MGITGSNFLNWWKVQLLANLKEPSLIIMDDAKFHLVYGKDVPQLDKMNKEEMIAYLRLNGVELGPCETAPMLRCKVKAYIKRASSRSASGLLRHEVILAPPPNYTDLQPLDSIWPLVMGRVARQHLPRHHLGRCERSARLRIQSFGKRQNFHCRDNAAYP